ncbi:hypothetical protein I6D99_12265, partial [Staphylococcus aureus]|nr:hypothetical protein [Staphylococcus aureus]
HILQMLKQRESHNRIMSILDIGRDNFYSRVKDIVNILYNLQQETDTSDTSDSSDTSYKSYTSD